MEKKTYVLKKDDRYYKLVENLPVLATRLNSDDQYDVYKPLDISEDFTLDMLLSNGYEIVKKGGKKSRKNRKHKKKSNTKRRRRN
jgi:hypothetical protein